LAWLTGRVDDASVVTVQEQAKERTMTGNPYLHNRFLRGVFLDVGDLELMTDGKGVLLDGSGGNTFRRRLAPCC